MDFKPFLMFSLKFMNMHCKLDNLHYLPQDKKYMYKLNNETKISGVGRATVAL